MPVDWFPINHLKTYACLEEFFALTFSRDQGKFPKQFPSFSEVTVSTADINVMRIGKTKITIHREHSIVQWSRHTSTLQTTDIAFSDQKN